MKKAEAGLTKAELITKAKELGFFKKKSVKSIWGRGNGHYYHTKPPAFVDGHESYEIKRADVEGKPKANPKPKAESKPAVKKEESKDSK